MSIKIPIMDKIKILVIIPVFGREDVFQTLKALREEPPKGIYLHFFVVDNGNKPPLSAKLAALERSDCQIIYSQENVGGAGAFRLGMKAALAAKADFIWLLDDDALATYETIVALYEEFIRLEQQGVKLGILGSTMLGRQNPNFVTEVGCRISPLTGKLTQCYHGADFRELPPHTAPVDYVAAASLLVRHAVLEQVGPFEDIFIHYDDADWCYRVREAGYAVYATTRSIIHHMEWQHKFAPWMLYYDTRNLLWFLKRHIPHRSAYWLRRTHRWLQMCSLYTQGCFDQAQYIRLGLNHIRSGKCLFRQALPTVPRIVLPRQDLFPTPASVWAISANGQTLATLEADIKPNAKKIRLFRYKDCDCRSLPKKLAWIIRRIALHALIHLATLCRPKSVILIDYASAQNYLLPFLWGKRVLFSLENGQVCYFTQPRPVQLATN